MVGVQQPDKSWCRDENPRMARSLRIPSTWIATRLLWVNPWRGLMVPGHFLVEAQTLSL